MRVKKQKKHRKVVRFFSTCFGFREPYKILCDGTFIHHLLTNALIPASDSVRNLVGGRVMIFTTRCILGELRSLGPSHVETLNLAQGIMIARCDHEKRMSAINCFGSVIGEDNSEHFFLATQDKDLRRKFREIRGVPIIYGIRNSLHMEEPSTYQRELIKSAEEQRLHMSEIELQKLKNSDSKGPNDSANEITGGTDSLKRKRDTTEKSKFKRNFAKGPNPLSCKKKKQKDSTAVVKNQDGTADGATKRKRVRKRKRATNKESLEPAT